MPTSSSSVVMTAGATAVPAVDSIDGKLEASSLPRYSERAFWDERYHPRSKHSTSTDSKEKTGSPNVESADRDWYVDWEALREPLCASKQPLKESSLRCFSPGVALEVGCGDRSIAAGLAEEGFFTVATDFSVTGTHAAAASLHHRSSVTSWDACDQGPPRSPAECERTDFVVADVRALPFRAQTFDAVLDKACFDALRVRDSQSALSEVARVLMPDSCFYCISNNESLLKAHAARVEGWIRLPLCPFTLPDVDDEVWVHCYRRTSQTCPATTTTTRTANSRARQLSKDAAQSAQSSAPDPGAHGCARKQVEHVARRKIWKIEVPWSLPARELDVLTDGSSVRILAKTSDDLRASSETLTVPIPDGWTLAPGDGAQCKFSPKRRTLQLALIPSVVSFTSSSIKPAATQPCDVPVLREKK